MELIADDSSIFTQVDEIQGTQSKIKRDHGNISAWAHQWKTLFNPDITKQAVEDIFSVQKHKTDHPELILMMFLIQEKDLLNTLMKLSLKQKLDISSKIIYKISK